MRKLLNANFQRLGKNRFFIIVLVCLALLSVFVGIDEYRTFSKWYPDVQLDNPKFAESVMFAMTSMLVFVITCFTAMFLGTEFDENTIRNKLIVGYTRAEIYFSYLIVCTAAAVIMALTLLAASAAAGYFFFRVFLLSPAELIYLVFCCVMSAAAIAATGTAITVCGGKKAVSVVAGMTASFALLFAASYLEGLLEAPELIYDSIEMTAEGVRYGNLVVNPEYIGGGARRAAEFVYDLLPTGQTIQLNNLVFERCARWPLLSAMLLLASAAAGYLPFRRKNIR